MRHFNYLSEEQAETIFLLKPRSFSKYSTPSELAYSLGATLYMPGIRDTLAKDILECKHQGLSTVVFCLEDSISDLNLEEAEDNLIKQVRLISQGINHNQLLGDRVPLMFIRVRSPEQMLRVMDRLGKQAKILTGFVFPKFKADQTGIGYFNILRAFNEADSAPFYGMPIFESSSLIYSESRKEELLAIKDLLAEYRNMVLNVRIGATDFSGIFGIRRGPDVTIYDIAVIRDCISDILNHFRRPESDYVVSGPVWEYFSNGGRLLKPQLRTSPFEEHYGITGRRVRSLLLNKYVDGLIKEVILDKENGIFGKTIIHPTHIMPVNSLYVVGHEEYLDAQQILENSMGENAVAKSSFTNKMNEVNPHLNWAKNMLHQ